MKSTTLFLAISAFAATTTASPTPSPSTPPPQILPSYTTMRINAANQPAPIIKSKVTSSLARSVPESTTIKSKIAYKIARSLPESPPHNHSSGLHHLSDPSTIALEHKSRTRKRTRRPSHAVEQERRSSRETARGDDSLVETENGDGGEEAKERRTEGRQGGGDKFLAAR